MKLPMIYSIGQGAREPGGREIKIVSCFLNQHGGKYYHFVIYDIKTLIFLDFTVFFSKIYCSSRFKGKEAIASPDPLPLF